MDAILNRRPPTTWEQFASSPLLFLARLLHTRLPPSQPECLDKIRVVCISDTHNSHHLQPSLPDGDILIHAGDLTNSGTKQELDDVLAWLESQPHPHKFFIAGNHDTCLADPDISQHISSTYPSLAYLQEASALITIRGRSLRVYGSPYTPKHGSWQFQYPRVPPNLYSPSENPRSEATNIWSRVPPLTDILVTHGPPFGHLDLGKMGCYSLLATLWRVRPKLHVFGHIHAGRGIECVRWDAANAAYEEICARRVGWIGLLRLAWWKAIRWFRRWSSGDDVVTVMVNAASVGGLKNEHRKGAFAIDI
ncbi:metallophosphoesterase domain-containing protein 1 [Coprinopsis cinerea okayama7|uniref:Metallophosphoesterase domain-containing protein 1 n=1 Tax=Coprinopsis cinerea (strain Okayama-7 / 130 / ATCC MYA-4618 / FGSC 9003) TaxID=240176 RepID=A8NEF0_COPC7|nr:metallophosphoesterase domain-containing protein 1 [Coprinopsis cinerea okayama7\|eukprot:XP_001833008.1 metallophosphoesterase domain-containing protein 1 [Coprinopsis cinerea okayama7\